MNNLTRLLAASLASFSLISTTFAVPPKELQTSTTINDLSRNFLSSKLQHGGLKNSMVSSVSLFYGLSVLNGGAAGDTATLLQSVLLKDSESSLTDIALSLAKVLEFPKSVDREGLGTFNLANSIWSTNGGSNREAFVFAEPFKADALAYYGASAHSIDFMKPGASDEINHWTEANTNRLIPEIIDDMTLREFKWVILNAAYFEGSWATPMRQVHPRQNYQFTGLEGDSKPAVAIEVRNYRSRVLDREDGSVAFSLPFVGHKYSFILYMPAEDEKDITCWLLEKAVNDMPSVISETLENQSQPYQLSVRMPKFAFADGVAMRKGSAIAKDLGLAPLFGKQTNLSLMVDKEKTAPGVADTTVGLIKQNTKIELDEKGVKAAAVTLVGGITKTSVRPPLPRRNIVVDRPFAFAIVENSSQTMLFSGVLVQPEQ